MITITTLKSDVNQEVCEKIRVQLNMTKGDASFFDVESNETQKAISFS